MMPSIKTDIRKLRPEAEVYIALEDLDFAWEPNEIETISNMWESGKSILKISEKTEREIDEVALLLMDLARKGKIRERKEGVFEND